MTDEINDDGAIVTESEPLPSQVQAEPETPAVEAQPESLPEDVADKTKRRFKTLLQERDHWKQEALKAKETLGKPAPKLEDFDHDIEKYTSAAVDHKAQEIAVNSVEQQALRAEQEAAKELESEFNRATAEAVKQFPDFDKVFDNSVPVSLQMAEAIVVSEKPADIAYYLGTNRDVAARIAALPPHMQGYEIARLEAKLSSAPLVSNAPRPPSQSVYGVNATGKKGYDDMSDEEFEATRAKERAAHRARMY